MEAGRMPSQRQLRVGEEIRAAIAQIFMHGETHVPMLDSGSITVSEVRISPDLKNATVYVMPLAGAHKEAIMTALKDQAGHIRKLLGRHVILRHLPRLFFKLDTSFEVAGRINELLNSDRAKLASGDEVTADDRRT
jgi:ribosome-binding factor A